MHKRGAPLFAQKLAYIFIRHQSIQSVSLLLGRTDSQWVGRPNKYDGLHDIFAQSSVIIFIFSASQKLFIFK